MNDGFGNHDNIKLVKLEAMDKKNFTSLVWARSMSAKCKRSQIFSAWISSSQWRSQQTSWVVDIGSFATTRWISSTQVYHSKT